MEIALKIACVTGLIVGAIGMIREKDKYEKQDMEHLFLISGLAIYPVFFWL